MRRKIGLLVALLSIAAAACTRAEARTRGVGDSLKPFIIKNCETGLQYCQVCAFAGKPTLMAVGDVDDAKFEDALARIQKIIDANPEKGVRAFALVGKVDGEKLHAAGDDAALNETKKRLGLSFPIVVLATKLTEAEEKNYAKFSESYAVKGSRTILLSNAEGKIVHADQIDPKSADAQLAELEQAIKTAL